MQENSTYNKWICSSVGDVEITMPVRINYQYDREAGDIVNFQVFCAADSLERHDITAYIAIEDAENIRAEILDAVKRGEY